MPYGFHPRERAAARELLILEILSRRHESTEMIDFISDPLREDKPLPWILMHYLSGREAPFRWRFINFYQLCSSELNKRLLCDSVKATRLSSRHSSQRRFQALIIRSFLESFHSVLFTRLWSPLNDLFFGRVIFARRRVAGIRGPVIHLALNWRITPAGIKFFSPALPFVRADRRDELDCFCCKCCKTPRVAPTLSAENRQRSGVARWMTLKAK